MSTDPGMSWCDGCQKDIDHGWMVPTGKTDTLPGSGELIPVYEFFCESCYLERAKKSGASK